MKTGSLSRAAIAIAVGAVVASAGWVVRGSAATLPVTARKASAFRSCALTAYPTTSTVMADTWADENSKTSNKAVGATVQVQSRASQNNRAYLRFNLAKCVPTIPSTVTVKKATLRLNLATAPNASRTYVVHRVIGPCPEAAATCWTESGLTWNNQPPAAATATSTLALAASSPVNQYYAFDVTADVAAIVTGTASNYGWRIADSAEGNATSVTVTFKAKDATGNAAGAPRLVVVFWP